MGSPQRRLPIFILVVDLEVSLLVRILSCLLSNVLLDRLELESDGRDGITTSPEMFSGKVSFLARELSCDSDGALALEKPDNGGNATLWRDHDTHVYVVEHDVPFDDRTLFLFSESVKHCSERCAYSAI